MSQGRLSGGEKKGTLVSRTIAEASFGTGPQKKCAGMFLTGDLVHQERKSSDRAAAVGHHGSRIFAFLCNGPAP